jgi:hypothetical protein
MGLCTNRVLMGRPLLALFISAKRHGSGPASLGSASNDKRKERAARLLTAVGTSRRLEVGQSMSALPPSLSDINLFHYSRALPRRRRTLKCDEHGVRFFLLQEMRRLACVPTKKRTGTSKTGLTFEKAVGPTVLQAVRSPGGTDPLIGSIQQSRLSSNLTRRTLSCRTARVQDRSS